MGIPEIVEVYFCSGIEHDVCDYIRDNEYDDDTDFSDYMKKMGKCLYKKAKSHYRNNTDLEIYDNLQDPELFEEIMKYAVEVGNEPVSVCFSATYVMCFCKYIEFWVEENIIHTANYLKNNKD
jgi:hypothetical protein